jgi:hypothetical protein
MKGLTLEKVVGSNDFFPEGSEVLVLKPHEIRVGDLLIFPAESTGNGPNTSISEKRVETIRVKPIYSAHEKPELLYDAYCINENYSFSVDLHPSEEFLLIRGAS